MKIIECVQGTPEWKQARCGNVTASRISDVMAKKDTARYQDYLAEIVSEILTGKPYESGYVSKDMERGTEQEKFARAHYETTTGDLIDQVGFVCHPTIEHAGCSPDGLISDKEGIS
jgi:hypothetical protein